MLERATDFCHWLKLLNLDESTELAAKISNCLQMRDLPVEETAQITKISKFKREKLTI